MLRQVIAHVLIIIKLPCPRIRIIQDLLTERLLIRSIFLFRSKEWANHLLLSDKEMGTMIMKRIDCWEWALAIRNQEISRNSGIGVDIEGDFLRLIPVSLLLAQDFHIPSRSRLRRRHHAFEDLSPCRFLPLLEVLNRTVSPSHRIGQFLLQRFYIGRNLSLPFILLPLLKLRLRRGLCKRYRRLQQCDDTICDNPFHSLVLFIRLVIVCKIKKLSAKRAQ